MVCKFEDTSVTIQVSEQGMLAYVKCHKHTVVVRLNKTQRLAYGEWMRGDPTVSTEHHGVPPDWWYKGLIERAKEQLNGIKDNTEKSEFRESKR